MRNCLPFIASALLIGGLLTVSGCHGPKAAGATKDGQAQTSGTAVTKHDPMISLHCMNRRVPVLMFHDVVEQKGPGSVWFDTTVRELRAQFDILAQRGITPISLDQLYDHLTTGAEIPRDSVVLTFDDNGEGFYQYVVPLLKEYKFPAAMFVHTSSPTMNKPGRPHMTWDQLRELSKEPLVTLGAHSVTHPPDMRELTEALATSEIADSKKELEKQLGKKVDYFAYPNGKFNNALENITQRAGFKMAFTIDHGLAEESPSLYAIHRYERQQFVKAWHDRDVAVNDAPAAIAEVPFADAPVQVHVAVMDGLKIAYVTGGRPSSILDKQGRQGVPDFVAEAKASAGINGGFFAMAGLRSSSNVMIGPSVTSTESKFVIDPSLHLGSKFIEKLRNRPLILWGPKELAIVPYQPETMNNEAVYRDFMPEMTDLFLAGAWIVHDGIPRTEEQLLSVASKDIPDPRRRAFLGITNDGLVIIGASLQTCSTERLGEAAAAAGVKEAVLLDSGFSTSLVYNGRIVVTGHTAKNLPSRPVPHAIVIMGQLDLTGADAMLASAAEGAKSPADIEGARRAAERRKQAREEAARKATEEQQMMPGMDPSGDRPGVTLPDQPGESPLSPPGEGNPLEPPTEGAPGQSNGQGSKDKPGKDKPGKVKPGPKDSGKQDPASGGQTPGR